MNHNTATPCPKCGGKMGHFALVFQGRMGSWACERCGWVMADMSDPEPRRCDVCDRLLDPEAGDVRVCSGECARLAAADDAEHWHCHDRKAEEQFRELATGEPVKEREQ